MWAYWRFVGPRTDEFPGWDIPLGPLVPGDYQDGWIRATFAMDDLLISTKGMLKLTSINVVREPSGQTVFFIGLIMLLAARKIYMRKQNSRVRSIAI